MLEVLKLVVQPILLERDAEGTVVQEHVLDPRAVYSLGGLEELWATLESEVDAANTSVVDPAPDTPPDSPAPTE